MLRHQDPDLASSSRPGTEGTREAVPLVRCEDDLAWGVWLLSGI